MLSPARFAFLPLLFILAAASGGCRSQPAAPPTPPPVSDDVWAVVDGREIRREAVEKMYRRSVAPDQAAASDEATSLKLSMLDQVIIQDLLVAAAGGFQIVVQESELDAAVSQARKDLTDEAFNKELTARNLTAADMREALRRDLLAQKVIEREVTAKVSVTDQDVNDFFTKNKTQFNLAEDSYHIAQIVVTPVRDPGLNNRTGDDATTAEAARAKVQMIMERLKGGAAFNEMAMDFSEEPNSTAQGGDVGLVSVSALRQAPPQLRDAVMKSQPGTVNVVGMDGAYTIVALVAKQPKGQRDPSMPEVKTGITASLRNEREQLLRTAYLETLRNKATIVNHVARRIVEAQGKLPATLQ